MIMPRGKELLLPVRPAFIWLSLAFALALNMIANMGLWGRAAWQPDMLAVVLVFWTVHQPRRIGVSIAFVFGLFMDVHQGALLGQHALAYTVLSYLAIGIHRRLLWFTVPSQAAQVLPLFVLAHALAWLIRWLGDGGSPGWWALLAPLLEALLWPVFSVVLLMPQRQAPDPDADRPL